MRAVGIVSGVAALAVVAALAALAVASWPSADDYCNGVLVDLLGIDGALAWLHANWSGRLVTSALLYASVAVLDVPSLRIVSIVAAVSVAGAAFQITRFVTPLDRTPSVERFALVLAALVLGLHAVLGQTVYWPTGAVVYWVPLLLLLHWLNGVRAAVAAGERTPALVRAFVVSVLLGDAIELVLPAAVAYAAVIAWQHRGNTAVRRAVGVRALGLCIGAAVLVTAPGNYVRAGVTRGSLDVRPAALLHALRTVGEQVIEAGWPMLAVLALLLVVGALTRGSPRQGERRPPPRHSEAWALLVGGIASVLPVLAAPAQAAPRNALYLLVGAFVAALLVVAEPDPGPRPAATATRYTWTASGTACLLAVIVAWLLATDAVQASARRTEQLARDAALRDPARAGTDVTVAPIATAAPRTLHAVDITADPAALVNWCVAMHYHLRSVRLAAP